MRGLLVADDAVLLAPHAEGIQAALAKFQTWCDTYHMQVGHDKCGLMVPLPEFQHLQAQAKEAPDQFMCQGQPIPVVDQYTYLGLQIDLNLSTDTLRKGRLEAGEQALRALAPMLANARVPLALKAWAPEKPKPPTEETRPQLSWDCHRSKPPSPPRLPELLGNGHSQKHGYRTFSSTTTIDKY
ncbi:hypothetical protein PSENEW3_00006334 [Picochlorum sp. SENEW3]|nr:hypothetical protein PSENEW3_00006334 [Picochlorum sp. SENEW3]